MTIAPLPGADDPSPRLLLTPGPLTTAPRTRQAMLRDWGSRDQDFIQMTARLRSRLLALAGDAGTHVAIPLQGSGTFIVEAALATLIGPQGKLLILINGAYGERMAEIARRMGRETVILHWAEDQPIDPALIESVLIRDQAISHIALVHCETTSGLLNPVQAVAEIAARQKCSLLVDAMSSFGALPLDLSTTPIAAVMASSNKCLEGVPGIGFALIAEELLSRTRGHAPSLSLDLHDQWRGFQGNGQWRFTPPVQIVAALSTALDLLDEEGGPQARLRRYTANLDRLLEGMTQLGFKPFLDRASQAPIIATFRQPADPRFDFELFYAALAESGFVIYPGKLTQAPSFRIGCIGQVFPADIDRLIAAIGTIIGKAGWDMSHAG